MAVKWWNWNVDKVLENVKLLYYADKFLDKHYSPKLELQDDVGGLGADITKYRKEGREIYSFIADFQANNPVWQRVISGFYKSSLQGAVLIFGVSEGFTKDDIGKLEKIILANGSSSDKVVNLIPLQDGRIFSPYILRNSTHFITSREMISLECMDWLWDTEVKIVSALDDAIFDGEPNVNWNKIFVH